MKSSFAERFCSHHGLPPDGYAPALFRRSLYPHAVWLVPVLRLLSPGYFAADFELIREAGAVTRRDQLREMLADFRFDRRNRAWLRSRLRLRVSTRRLQQTVYTVIEDVRPGDAIPAGDSTPPVPASEAPRSPPGTSAQRA